MKRLILFTLFFILFTQSKVFLQTKNDFFPLSTGSYYLYKYNAYSSANDFQSWESWGSEDTGWVKYSVEGFEKKDTLIIWKIKENDSVYTHEYSYTSSGKTDTCYWTVQEWCFELKESLTGNHKLTCSSGYGIWNSPISISWVFSPQLERYSTDSNSIKVDFDVLTARTTVVLKHNVGITSFLSQSHFGNRSSTSRVRNAVLIEQCLPSINSVNNDNSSRHEFFISQNYPNPFNPSTTIRYSLAAPSYVTLKIFDLLGREVTALVDELKPAGIHNAVWNAGNISSGVYFYELRAGSFAEKKKMMLVR